MTTSLGTSTWTGALVAERLGVTARDSGAAALRLTDLFGLALRINPRRAHLLVSTVLAKHVPTDPALVRAGGALLGVRAARALGRLDDPAEVDDALSTLAAVLQQAADPDEALQLAGRLVARVSRGEGLVFGYAETATGLGHLVGAALDLPVIHSTRRRVPGTTSALGFDESHSHATEHRVLPTDPDLLHTPGPVVLVDDELSTGATVLNTVRALQRVHEREHYVVAALIDVRTEADRERMAAVAAELGIRIDVVSLASGTVEVPAEAPQIAARLLAAAPEPSPAAPDAPLGRVSTLWADPVDEAPAAIGGRHGFTPDDEQPLRALAEGVAAQLAVREPWGDDVLVLGTEELMYAPLVLAESIADAQRSAGPGRVRFSTTTRSPVQPWDDAGYAIRHRLSFASFDRQADAGERFAYNVRRVDGGRWSDVVVVVDAAAYTEPLWAAGGLLEQLRALADRVRLVVLPDVSGLPAALHGPRFGSYAPHEASWLLKDLSHVDLEAETAARERAIQSGQAHYAESLPIEYQPDAAYQELFSVQLSATADRVATAVGAVAELSRIERDRDDLVLVSLARAGTPIGVLMRRWAEQTHGLDWPHYAVSIVRDRGIDENAMRWLASRYDPARVLFVDGWTGKGAITREFAAAIEGVNRDLGLGERGFHSDLAVLADPGECVRLFGTRDDFLIPSACLNSTVSGLVSRTVLNASLIGPEDFHGAKFYAELAERDVSNVFLDAISARFGDVAEAATARAAELHATDRTPTWVGWQATDRVREQYGIGNINLVKPGVGETTRVLLRRVPWKVVVNPERRADLKHVELLAADRGVEVVEVPGLPYSCMGLIRPEEQDG